MHDWMIWRNLASADHSLDCDLTKVNYLQIQALWAYPPMSPYHISMVYLRGFSHIVE